MKASEQYLKHVADILTYGDIQAARGTTFKETVGMLYQASMQDPVIRIPLRDLGYKFAVAEPYWILSGNNLLSGISNYGKMSPYSDDGYFMSGAYGPKIVDQLGYVCKTLADDQGSRQAVINIWRERPGPSKDIPCTLSLQFLLRDGKIHCMATMRSSDAYMGLPYDSILFSLCSAYVLSILREHYSVTGHKLGQLKVFLGSAHIYDRDFDKCERMVNEWDYLTSSDTDFDLLAGLPPAEFMEVLASCTMDQDGSGILELGRMFL